MIFTPAYAQTAAGPDPITSLLLPMALLFVIMYFLIIRPQQKRAKEHKQMIDSLRRGDEVITAGGLYGKVTKVKDGEEEIEIEISDGVKVRMVRAMISGVPSKAEPAASAAKS